jgi:hypothetical protein
MHIALMRRAWEAHVRSLWTVHQESPEKTESEIEMFESHPQITIRRLHDGDRESLAELAGRDSSNVPTGTVIAAVAPGGAMLAATSVETRELVADPFLPSEHAVALLRVRARQLVGDERHEARRRRFRRTRSRGALPSSPPGAGGRLLSLMDLRHPS